MSAARTKYTYVAARYRCIAARRGKERALVALEHSILVSVWHMFTNDIGYADLGSDYLLHRSRRARQTAARQPAQPTRLPVPHSPPAHRSHNAADLIERTSG